MIQKQSNTARKGWKGGVVVGGRRNTKHNTETQTALPPAFQKKKDRTPIPHTFPIPTDGNSVLGALCFFFLSPHPPPQYNPNPDRPPAPHHTPHATPLCGYRLRFFGLLRAKKEATVVCLF